MVHSITSASTLSLSTPSRATRRLRSHSIFSSPEIQTADSPKARLLSKTSKYWKQNADFRNVLPKLRPGGVRRLSNVLGSAEQMLRVSPEMVSHASSRARQRRRLRHFAVILDLRTSPKQAEAPDRAHLRERLRRLPHRPLPPPAFLPL